VWFCVQVISVSRHSNKIRGALKKKFLRMSNPEGGSSAARRYIRRLPIQFSHFTKPIVLVERIIERRQKIAVMGHWGYPLFSLSGAKYDRFSANQGRGLICFTHDHWNQLVPRMEPHHRGQG
jgi:hypothetical protein